MGTIRKWTYENCVKESKKYTYLNEFMINSASAYTTDCHNKWLKDFTWLLRKRMPPNYWTEKKCYNEAKKYIKLKDFILNAFTAYNKASKNKWLENYTWLERNPCIKDEILTYDVCYNEAKKYEYISEFRSKSSNVYSKSCKKGYIKNFTWLKKCNSFLELFFEKNLIKNNIIYESQKTFPWLKMDRQQFLDFYLPRYNIAIECQGGQHYGDIHGNSEIKKHKKFEIEDYELIKKRDENKYLLCKEHGIKIVYYALKKYESKHTIYTSIHDLFNIELGLDFKCYNLEEIALIENQRKRKNHKTNKFKCGCEIIQKDLDGVEIKRWKSIDDICNFYHCTHSCIISAIKGVNNTAKGFIWECDLNTGKYVYEIDENGNVLHKFDTPEEASRFYNLCNVSIRQRCDKGNLKPFKGHIFTYCPDKFNKDEFSKIDKTEYKLAGYWTKEKSYEEAKKYSTYSEFAKKCPGGCTKAYKMGWLKEWKLFKTAEKITFERCVKEASRYERIQDFKKENAHLYNAMLKNGWVRKIFKYNGKKMSVK